MDKKLLFGIYHTDCRKSEQVFSSLAHSDYVNVFLVEGDYREESFARNFELLDDPSKGIFVSVAYLGFYHEAQHVADVGEEARAPINHVYPDYRKRVDEFIAFLKEKGYYDSILGFYMDEPMLWGATNAQLEEFTGYFRTVAATEKRFFVCFSLAGVAPDFWTIEGAEAITPQSSQYITDIAFDMYHKWSPDYEAIYHEMMMRTGNRADLRVWFVPCTMDYRGDKTEEHCLEHLENCYRLLKETPCPGGLMCYTYHTFPTEVEALGNIGLDKLSDPMYPKYWKRLLERIHEIGREVVQTKI